MCEILMGTILWVNRMKLIEMFPHFPEIRLSKFKRRIGMINGTAATAAH